MTTQRRKLFTGYVLIFMYLAMCVQCHPGKNVLQEDLFGQITKIFRFAPADLRTASMISCCCCCCCHNFNSFQHRQLCTDSTKIYAKQEEGRIDKKEIANKMLKHMMDVVRTLYSDLGASDQELQEVDRKRSAIMACYFQAVSCY